jgi:ELWxxDGT repeat protein
MVEQGLDLSAFDGKTVRLRFSFDSVDAGFNGDEGWVIDDVVVTVDQLPGMPEARPGGPYSAFRNSDVVLDGTASTDPDGDPLTYQWNFGNGTTGTGATATHRYASPGAYGVTLVVSDGTLRSAPASTVVTVSNRLPVAHPGGPYSGYAETPVTFDGSGSFDLDFDALTYQWSFGDGTTGGGVSPIHPYIAPGTYRVSLVVHDGIDASSTAETTAVIAPEGVPPSPVTDLSGVDAGPRSAKLTWTSTGDDGGLGTAAAYDLRYGTTPIDEQIFVTATPVASPNLPKPAGNPESLEVFGLSPGTTYYFALKVIDDVGNASPLSNVAAITTPSEMFLLSDDFESGTSRWSLGGSDGQGGPSLWHIASHRFGSPSSAFYYGRDDTRTYETGARNFGSLTSIPIDLQGHEHARLSFQHFFETQAATSADLLRVLVSADDGGNWTTVFQRSSAGSNSMVEESADLSAFDGQVVRVRFDFDTVNDLENDHEGWFVDDVLLAVESRPGVPTANPGGPYSGFRRLALSFDGTGSSDPDGDGLTYRWSFGDGTTGVGPAPAHAYTGVGTYTVSLVVHDGTASSPPATTAVTIDNRPPVASPGGPYTGYTNVSLGFDGSGSSDPEGDALIYSWTFGDGGSAQGPTPAHVYSSPGAYEVTLVVSDGLASSPPVATTATIVAPQLTLTFPNTPVSWPVGSTQTIAWTSNLAPASTVRIEMSPDGGAAWIAIASAAPNSGIYDWKVKPPHTVSARVRVSWTVSTSVADVSDSNFTIGSPAYRVKKINPLASTSPTSLVNVRGSLFFLANDGTAHGTELWKSDGTEAGTVLVKDITAGSGSTDINLLTPVGRYVYFVTGNYSRLWRSDGTEAGTFVVHDIVYFGYAFPLGSLTAVGETLFYTLCQTSDGCELWRARASGGVARVKDIVPGSGSSSPTQLAAVSDKLFFSAYHPDTGRELWKSDGTEAGTVLVKDIGPGNCCSGNPMQLTDVGGTLLYNGATDGSSLYPDRELWKSDGTAAGTVQVKNDAYSYLSLFITETEAAGGLLFYSAYPENSCCTYDRELYRSDGTTLGTGRVRDIWIGESGSNPQYLTAVGGKVFFTASELGNPNQLFMSDGTAAGTKRLNQVTPDVASSPSNLARVGDSLFFQGNRAPFGVELWQTDGTAEGTALAQDVLAGTPSSYPGSLTVSGHRLFFVASDLSNHRELWVLNLPVNEAPAARAGGPYAGFRHQPVPFSASGSFDADGDALTYSWTFGDGSNGSGIGPTHAYAEPGTYVVTLVVSDGTATSAPATASVTIQNRPPVARAGGPYTGVRHELDGRGRRCVDLRVGLRRWSDGNGSDAGARLCDAGNVHGHPRRERRSVELASVNYHRHRPKPAADSGSGRTVHRCQEPGHRLRWHELDGRRRRCADLPVGFRRWGGRDGSDAGAGLCDAGNVHRHPRRERRDRKLGSGNGDGDDRKHAPFGQSHEPVERNPFHRAGGRRSRRRRRGSRRKRSPRRILRWPCEDRGRCGHSVRSAVDLCRAGNLFLDGTGYGRDRRQHDFASTDHSGQCASVGDAHVAGSRLVVHRSGEPYADRERLRSRRQRHSGRVLRRLDEPGRRHHEPLQRRMAGRSGGLVPAFCPRHRRSRRQSHFTQRAGSGGSASFARGRRLRARWIVEREPELRDLDGARGPTVFGHRQPLDLFEVRYQRRLHRGKRAPPALRQPERHHGDGHPYRGLPRVKHQLE